MVFVSRGKQELHNFYNWVELTFSLRTVITGLLKTVEDDEVIRRRKRGFRRRHFWAAGVNDVWPQDQHDKWGRFGLWLHAGLEAFSGEINWLKIWWTNRNPRLIAKYYLDTCRRIGGTCPILSVNSLSVEQSRCSYHHAKWSWDRKLWYREYIAFYRLLSYWALSFPNASRFVDYRCIHIVTQSEEWLRLCIIPSITIFTLCNIWKRHFLGLQNSLALFMISWWVNDKTKHDIPHCFRSHQGDPRYHAVARGSIPDRDPGLCSVGIVRPLIFLSVQRICLRLHLYPSRSGPKVSTLPNPWNEGGHLQLKGGTLSTTSKKVGAT